jgi:hypothetical protein
MTRNPLGLSTWVAASLFTCTAALFAAGEFYLQMRSTAIASPGSWTAYHAQRGWVLKPGRYSYLDSQSLKRVELSINDLGLRNAPLAREPGEGVERITVLGDSFVFGAPLGNDNTITGQLQHLLGNRFEVVNVSVPDYGTGQEFRLIEELQAKNYQLGRKLFLVFQADDIQDNLGLDTVTLEPAPWRPTFSIDSTGQVRQSVPRLPDARRGSVFERSLLMGFLTGQLEAALSRPALFGVAQTLGPVLGRPVTPALIAGWYGPQWEHMWLATEQLLERAVGEVRTMPAPPEIYIAFVPAPLQVREDLRRTAEAGAERDPRYATFLADPDRPQRVLGSLARRIDVRFVDLTPPLRLALSRSQNGLGRDGRFSAAGYGVAAKTIYQQAVADARATTRVALSSRR